MLGQRNKYYGSNGYLNEVGTWVVGFLFLFVVFLAVCLVPGPVKGEPAEGSSTMESAGADDAALTEGLIKAQRWFLAKVRGDDPRHKRVEILAPLVAVESTYYSVDPFILMTTLIDESSLRLKQTGRSNNEKGLGQQHGQALVDSIAAVKKRGIDPYSIHGQIARTAWVLRRGELRCGNELGMVTRYLSGKCKSKSVKTQRKAKRRLMKVAKLKSVSSVREID